MTLTSIAPTGVETYFHMNDIIVSKTNCQGIITYANEVFLNVAGYSEGEVLGKPHNLIRHPDMPRCVFQFLWDSIKSGREIFAYVINLAKNGDHYWVHAHVTPTFDGEGRIIGYHSNRRVPEPTAVQKIIPIYHALTQAEAAAGTGAPALQAGMDRLNSTLRDAGMDYDEFVFSL